MIRRTMRTCAVLALILATVSLTVTCSDSRSPTEIAANAWRIRAVSGDAQTGPALTQLADPMSVQVLDNEGNPVPAYTVSFEVTSPEGYFAGSSRRSVEVVTNSSGMTSVYLFLGAPDEAGYTVQASASRSGGVPLQGSPVRFTALATSAADTTSNGGGGNGGATPGTSPSALEVISGDNQTAGFGGLLPLPVTLAVLDADGRRLPEATVKLTVTTPVSVPAADGGFIGEQSEEVPTRTAVNLVSDANGLVSFVWRLGPGPHLDNTVVAEIRLADGTLRTVTLRARALPTPDTANRLVILSGNRQVPHPVNTLLPLPLVVRVVDTTRTGVGGDATGAPIANFPVLFSAYSPSGDGRLDDTPGIEPSGTGRLSALTDNDGLAAVRWWTGTRTGGPDDAVSLRDNNYVVAVAVFADGSQDSVVFYTTAMPQAASAMSVSGPIELSGAAGSSLNLPVVNVVDQFGNVVRGVGIQFSIGQSPGAALISQPLLLTDENGNVFGVVDQLSTRAGTMKVSASNGSHGGSPVTFEIEVLADVAASILRSGGNDQTARQGEAWSNALQVLVLDRFGNPRPGQQVRYAVTSGSATLTNEIQFTGSDGTASTTATPNAAGSVTINATTSIGGVDVGVTFNLTATAP